MHYQAEPQGYFATAATPMLGAMTQYGGRVDVVDRIARLASGSAVVIFSLSSCCMCHAAKRLFRGMGVNPTVYELDQDPRGNEVERTLVRLVGFNSPGGVAVPVVFVGGKLVGAMDRVMAAHINGSLVPLLKEAGALWL